jgi:hypothetical protein
MTMDVKERIEAMLKEDIALTTQIERIVMRMNASVAMLRQEMREVNWSHEEELERLRRQRAEIRNNILAQWESFASKATVLFPSAKVVRRNYRELVVHDKVALLDAIDRAGRLDLVEYSFKESEVAKLIEKGKLEGLDGKVEVKSNHQLQVKAVKQDG